MSFSFQCNPAHLERQVNLLREYNKALEEQNRTRNQERKLLQNQITRLSLIIKQQNKSQLDQQNQLKANLNDKQSFDNLSLNQIALFQNNHSIGKQTYHNHQNHLLNQLQKLQSKYDTALIQNTQLISQLQNRNEEINRLLKEQNQGRQILQNQNQNIQYLNILYQLQNKIKVLQNEVLKRQQNQSKIVDLEKQNDYLKYQVTLLEGKYKTQINQLHYQLQKYKNKSVSMIDSHTKRNPSTFQLQQKTSQNSFYSRWSQYSDNRQVSKQTKNTNRLYIQIQKYKNDLLFYKQKIKIYQDKIKQLKDANNCLQLQLNSIIECKNKSSQVFNLSNNIDLRVQVSQLKNQMSQLKNIAFSKSYMNKSESTPYFTTNKKLNKQFISSLKQNNKKKIYSYNNSISNNNNVSCKALHTSKPNQKSTSRFGIKTTTNKFYNQNLKWQDIQFRIGQLRNENLSLKKQLHFN